MAEFDLALCNERHNTIDRRLSKGETEDAKAHERIDDVIAAMNGKFTKLFYFFLATLLSSLGGTLAILIALMSKGGG